MKSNLSPNSAERGATCVEYAILLLLVAIVSVTGIVQVREATAELLLNDVLLDGLGGGTVTNL